MASRFTYFGSLRRIFFMHNINSKTRTGKTKLNGPMKKRPFWDQRI